MKSVLIITIVALVMIGVWFPPTLSIKTNYTVITPIPHKMQQRILQQLLLQV